MQEQKFICIPRFMTWTNSRNEVKSVPDLDLSLLGDIRAVPVKDGSQCRGSGFLGRGYTNGKIFE